jgi:hypothetical protein
MRAQVLLRGRAEAGEEAQGQSGEGEEQEVLPSNRGA